MIEVENFSITKIVRATLQLWKTVEEENEYNEGNNEEIIGEFDVEISGGTVNDR